MNEQFITELLDILYEGVRDGTITREYFGQQVLRLTESMMTTAIRAAVVDHETLQVLLTARNLPRC
jgi:hypothetical protein